MTLRIPFVKMSGAGNDFVVIDNRAGIVPQEGRGPVFERWCRRRTGIGADGVLLVEPAEGYDFRMRYYNADGGEVESCGNGARCIARFAQLIGAAPARLRFLTQAGPYEAVVDAAGDVLLTMSDPRDLRRSVPVSVPGLFDGAVDFINTGVPHVVIRWEELDAAPVVELGRAIRRHAAFAPAGTNVNFYRVRVDGGLDIRTYERGVEDETLACGTGAVATALIASLGGLVESPAALHTAGGPILRIHFSRDGGGMFSGIKLEGEARVVFFGEIAVA